MGGAVGVDLMIIGFILLLIAIAEVALGVWFLTKYQRNQATMWYGLFAIGAAIYVASNGYGFLFNSIQGDLTERFGWLGGGILTAFFLAFSFTFPLPKKKLSELLPLVIWPLAVFIPGFLWTDVFLHRQPLIHYGTGYQTAPGPFFWFFVVYFAVYWMWAITNLVIRLRVSDGLHRWMIRMVLFGILASLAVSSVFDITLPLVTTSRFGYVGSLFTSVWLGFTSYIILRK